MSASLKPIGDIFTETWQLYKQRVVPILVVILVTTFLAFAVIFGMVLLATLPTGGLRELAGRFDGSHFDPMLVLFVCAAFLVMMVILIWSQAATIAASVDEELSITEALRKGWQYLVPLAWVSTLYMGIVMTGFVFFIIPGLFLGLSMSLSSYAMFDDDLRGMDAVLASHVYVRGRWWNTFGKFLAVWLLSVAAGSVPVVGQVLSFLFTPYLLLFMVVVYRDLKKTAGEVDLSVEKRWLWNTMAAIGIIVPTLALIGVLVTLAPRLPDMLEQMEKDEAPGLELPQSGSDVRQESQAGPRVRQLDSADGTLIWRDPAGDTGNSPLDIKQVAVNSNGEELVLKVCFNQPLDALFSSGATGDLFPAVSFYFDIDVDRMTGGPARGGAGRAGYDQLLDVVLERTAENTGQIHAALYSLGEDSRRSKGLLEEKNISLKGRALKLHLPYGLLGMQSGRTIRLCFREPAQQQGGGLSKDKLIPLQ